MLRNFFNKYVIDALSFMALGLFCSLIIGVIIGQIAKIEWFSHLGFVAEMLSAKSPVIGAAIGMAIALGLKYPILVIISSCVTGALGYNFGGPVGSYIATLVGAELGNLVSKKTPADIIVTPLVVIIAGGIIAKLICPAIDAFMIATGEIINSATELNPFLMGIVVSVVVGCCLTLPISSVALCVMLNLDGLAAGAATAGCCAQMIGFAVISWNDNRFGGFISQGLGTSMLQIGNIIKNPLIWIPPTLASAVLGPISTMLFRMTNEPIGAGMGTSGLVGPFTAFVSMNGSADSSIILIGNIIILYFIAPAILSWLIYKPMFHKGWIKKGDMKLS